MKTPLPWRVRKRLKRSLGMACNQTLLLVGGGDGLLLMVGGGGLRMAGKVILFPGFAASPFLAGWGCDFAGSGATTG